MTELTCENLEIHYKHFFSLIFIDIFKMGNMMVNKRVEETMFSETPENEKNKTKEYRVLPKHMYGVSIDYWP